MSVSITEKLKQLYASFSGENQVIIVINADPDAMSSAIAMKRLLWRKVAVIDICYINEIKRSDNLSMIRLLGIKMKFITDVDISHYDKMVMIDSQPDHNELFRDLKPDLIIDHHPLTDYRASYMDIRPDYGATASIMTEYLKSARIKPSEKLATALYFGIKTDTSNFQRQTLIEDIRAFQYLFKFINVSLEKRIVTAEVPLDFLKFYQQAFNSYVIKGTKLYVHLKDVPSPDLCVLLADFFMRIDKVNWTIVSGNYDNKVIIIFRNDGIRKNAGNVAKKSFGSYGSAGGHKTMARAEINYSDLTDVVSPKNHAKLSRWIIKHVEIRSSKKKIKK